MTPSQPDADRGHGHGWVIFEAVGRFRHPQVIDGGPVLRSRSVAPRQPSAVVLARPTGASLNMRGAFLHMAADSAGSVAVIVAAIAVLVADLAWVDPVASLIIAALVIWSTWGLMRDTVRILLEARGLLGAQGGDLAAETCDLGCVGRGGRACVAVLVCCAS